MKTKNNFSVLFEKFSSKVTKATGSSAAFIIAILIILLWIATGPIFHFSNTWQLVINTGTTIITFLMVFVIQHSQNKDTTAVQLKLNELIASEHQLKNEKWKYVTRIILMAIAVVTLIMAYLTYRIYYR